MIEYISKPIEKIEDREQITISLEDLDVFGREENDLGYGQPIFIQYSSKEKDQRIKLMDAATKKQIRIPARRTSCRQCIKRKILCSQCQFCKEEICCRSWKCIYDHEYWKSHNELEEYQSCICLAQKKNPKLKLKGKMQIDFRLLSLIEKIGKWAYKQYDYMLIKTGDALWLREEQVSEDSIIRVNRVFHQNNFGYLQQTQNEKDRLALFNSKTISTMFKQTVKDYLTTKQTWEVSNLEQQCEQIIESLITNRSMQSFKTKLQESSDINDYVNQPSLYYRGKLQETNEALKAWSGLQFSSSSNPSILYFYLQSHNAIVVKNASYSQEDLALGIRIIPIMQEVRDRGIWFKDRKGDIYSINGSQLFIHKYHLDKKVFSRFSIVNDEKLASANQQQCLLYIGITDRVYYFNSGDFTKSFYFDLLRDSSAHNVQGINLRNDIFKDDKKIRDSSNERICYTLYVMEDVKYRDSNDNERNDLLPVIYLLYHRSNNQPLPLSVYRFVHANDATLKVSEFKVDLQSNMVKNTPLRIMNNFQNGLFFPMKIDGALWVYFYSELDGKPTLMSGKLKIATKIIEWNDQNLEFSSFTEFKYADRIKIKPQFSKLLSKLTKYYISPGEIRKDAIVVNDMNGCPANNTVHYLGFISSEEQPIEFMLTNIDGQLEWKFFNIS